MMIKVENSFTTGQEIFAVVDGKWAKVVSTGGGKYVATGVNDVIELPVKGALRATWREIGHYGQSTRVVRVEVIGDVDVTEEEILAIVGAEGKVPVVRQ